MGANKMTVAGEFTRPGNSTPYAVGDVVSDNASATTPFTIENAARGLGGSGYIVGARLTCDNADFDAETRVHIFRTPEVTVAGDNSALARPYDEDSDYVGSFDFAAASSPAAGGSSGAQNNTVRLPFTCADDSSNLYAVIETLTAFTPSSGDGYRLSLVTELD